MKIINILGCMGVGKTTLIASMKRYLEAKGIMVKVYYERFADNPYWRDMYINQNNPDPLKLQIAFMNQYIENVIDISNIDQMLENAPEIVIMDQQLYAGLRFARTQNSIGLMNDTDFEQYKIRYHLIQKLLNQIGTDTKRVIDSMYDFVIDDSAENIQKKIEERDRPEEKNLPEGFVSSLSSNFAELASRQGFIRIDGASFEKGEIPTEILTLLEAK